MTGKRRPAQKRHREDRQRHGDRQQPKGNLPLLPRERTFDPEPRPHERDEDDECEDVLEHGILLQQLRRLHARQSRSDISQRHGNDRQGQRKLAHDQRQPSRKQHKGAQREREESR
jgi:hypothetical protein